ncbi:unnamed protein product [Paramecium pentaurelia]|uniref:Uncharacterized protein n=1 Tax=Paramecium pentaurelia TaxID=43138 RepID=A0A8S1T805_9CILI|nr:unnamed protein product [Paramecium pentaurelia]
MMIFTDIKEINMQIHKYTPRSKKIKQQNYKAGNQKLETLLRFMQIKEYLPIQCCSIQMIQQEQFSLEQINQMEKQTGNYVKPQDILKILVKIKFNNSQCINYCEPIIKKYLTEDNLKIFTTQYEKAKNQTGEREASCSKFLDSYENDLELLELIGVEDMLQKVIDATLESLKNAGIQIWMLTGDKVETAQCIAISTGLKSPTQEMFVIKDIEDSLILKNELNQFALKNNSVLVLDGQSLKVSLEFQYTAFFHVALNSHAVVCCRFSPLN